MSAIYIVQNLSPLCLIVYLGLQLAYILKTIIAQASNSSTVYYNNAFIAGPIVTDLTVYNAKKFALITLPILRNTTLLSLNNTPFSLRNSENSQYCLVLLISLYVIATILLGKKLHLRSKIWEFNRVYHRINTVTNKSESILYNKQHISEYYQLHPPIETEIVYEQHGDQKEKDPEIQSLIQTQTQKQMQNIIKTKVKAKAKAKAKSKAKKYAKGCNNNRSILIKALSDNVYTPNNSITKPALRKRVSKNKKEKENKKKDKKSKKLNHELNMIKLHSSCNKLEKNNALLRVHIPRSKTKKL